MNQFPHGFPPPPETGYKAEQRLFAEALQAKSAEALRRFRARFMRRILFKIES